MLYIYLYIYIYVFQNNNCAMRYATTISAEGNAKSRVCNSL